VPRSDLKYWIDMVEMTNVDSPWAPLLFLVRVSPSPMHIVQDSMWASSSTGSCRLRCLHILSFRNIRWGIYALDRCHEREPFEQWKYTWGSIVPRHITSIFFSSLGQWENWRPSTDLWVERRKKQWIFLLKTVLLHIALLFTFPRHFRNP